MTLLVKLLYCIDDVENSTPMNIFPWVSKARINNILRMGNVRVVTKYLLINFSGSRLKLILRWGKLSSPISNLTPSKFVHLLSQKHL